VWILSLASVIASETCAQAPLDNGPPVWHIVLDGESVRRSELGPATKDDAVRKLLSELARDGFAHAAVDSVVATSGVAVVYVTRGRAVPVADLRLEGMRKLAQSEVDASWITRAGRPFSEVELQTDLRRLLEMYERAGHFAAAAHVERLDVTPAGYVIVIQVEEGAVPLLRGVELWPEARVDPKFAAQLAGLTVGRPLVGYSPAEIRRELEASGLFDLVGQPEIVIIEGDALVRVPVEEVQPGVIDLVLGYLPPAVPGGSGQVVGSGSMTLRNLFGRGRRLQLEMVRSPGFVSTLDVRAGDPFVLGLPVRLEAGFSGLQQDTTFARHRLFGETGYRIAPGLEAVGVVSREFVESGIAGAVDVAGRPRVPPSDAWFAGAGIMFRRIDRPMNPRRGLALATLLEQGTKRRVLPDSGAEPLNMRQQRLSAAGRIYIPTLPRHVAVLGGDVTILLGQRYDDSDLFRVGGAATLRGYDEGQFRGNVVSRALFEYRYQLDPTSFAFIFSDVGYVRRPETPGVVADERMLVGYGIGMQYRTPLGLVTASYALNPDDGPTRGRVHVGLSVGL
jgi:outer membrane protein assembly factor BamA